MLPSRRGTMCKGMGTLALVLAVAVVLTAALAVVAQSADQWLSDRRDPANTASAVVDLYAPPSEVLNLLWEAPALGSSGKGQIVCWSDGAGTTQLVIAGNFVYDAWTGELVYYLPEAGDMAAITGDVLLTVRPRKGISGYEYFAYDLPTMALLWYHDSLAPGSLLTIGQCWGLNAKDGIFYVTGNLAGTFSGAAAAVDAQDGNVKWEKYLDLEDVEIPAVSGSTVYASGWASGGVYAGIVSLDAETGDELAADRTPVRVNNLTVDEQYGLVWAYLYDADGMDCLCAWTKALVKKYTIDLGGYFVCASPTLGWGKDLSGVEQPAVFVQAQERGPYPSTASRVYAVNRSTGVEMWREQLPAYAEFTGATYSGGKLFISTVDHRTLVLDTYNDGKIVDILNWGDWTYYFSSTLVSSPVVVEVADLDGVPHGVMYFFGEGGSVVALSTAGTNPPPQVFHLTVAADPLQIGLQSRSTVTATFVDNHMQPFAGAQVNFSCDAGTNQGSLSPTVVSTDANGKAVTTYFSGKREGTVTVTATTSGAAAASVAITVRSGGTPTVGTIQGTVYDAASKPVKDATVKATGPVTKTVTTNKQGKYSIGSLPVGTYTVWGSKAGVGTATATGVVTAGQTTTVNLYLK